MTLQQIESLTIDANTVKDLTIELILSKNLITNEQSTELKEKYHIFVYKTNWFKSIINRLGYKMDEYRYKIVEFK